MSRATMWEIVGIVGIVVSFITKAPNDAMMCFILAELIRIGNRG